MSSLRLLLGLIPSTSSIEQAENALVKEFEKLHVFEKSDTLARYFKLNDLVNSSDFLEKKKQIESLRYRNSEECEREKEFNSLQKAKDIVMYFRTLAGSSLKKFRDLDGSKKIKDFEALQTFIGSNVFRQRQKMKPITFKDSDEYRKFLEYKSLKSDPEIKAYYKALKKAAKKGNPVKSKVVEKFEELGRFITSQEFLSKKNMKPITFKDTEEYKKLLEYKRIKNSPEIKEFYKFRDSKEYTNFLNTDKSTRLSRYDELKEYVATREFKERKNYLLDKKRFEKTEMFREIEEYKKLKKNEDIIWFFKVRDSDKFDLLKGRELMFSDEFEGEKLDAKKWLTNYYWGNKLLKDNYSVGKDLQAYTEKDNLEVRNSLLRIQTRPQKTTGKVWTATEGFRTKEFSYTSGLINSGNSFRQKYGIFSAKIKLGNPVARNNFWMLAEKITPHLDICRTSAGKVWADYISGKDGVSKTKISSKFSSDFYIYTLEWTKDRLIWKINGKEFFRQTSNIPHEPMYILLAGGLEKPISGSTTMEVDWVRVYQFK